MPPADEKTLRLARLALETPLPMEPRSQAQEAVEHKIDNLTMKLLAQALLDQQAEMDLMRDVERTAPPVLRLLHAYLCQNEAEHDVSKCPDIESDGQGPRALLAALARLDAWRKERGR